MNSYRLLSALVGLTRALEGNDHLVTEETNALLLKGLKAYAGTLSEEEAEEEIEKLHREKQRIVPDCFICRSPCGRTADPEIIALTEIQLRILDEMVRKAETEAPDMSSIYMGLYSLGTDWELTLYENILSSLRS